VSNSTKNLLIALDILSGDEILKVSI